MKDMKKRFSKHSNHIIGCAIEVHRNLGPGLLESIYEQCLAQEFWLTGINFKRQEALPIEYKGIYLDCGYRIDLLVEDEIIIEIKSVNEIIGIHEAQILTYMKLAKIKYGLLINFNVTLLKDGLKSFIL